MNTALDDAIRRAAHKYILSRVKKMETVVRQILSNELENSAVFRDLRSNGQLCKELGLLYPESKVERIADAIIASVHSDVSITPRGDIRILIQAIPSNYLFIIGLPESEEHSKSVSFNWLDWLLNNGTEVLVQGYYYKDPNKYELPFSRGGGFMKLKAGSSWSMPTQFAGTHNNNFITDVCKACIPQIEKAMMNLL